MSCLISPFLSFSRLNQIPSACEDACWCFVASVPEDVRCQCPVYVCWGAGRSSVLHAWSGEGRHSHNSFTLICLYFFCSCGCCVDMIYSHSGCCCFMLLHIQYIYSILHIIMSPLSKVLRLYFTYYCAIWQCCYCVNTVEVSHSSIIHTWHVFMTVAFLLTATFSDAVSCCMIVQHLCEAVTPRNKNLMTPN